MNTLSWEKCFPRKFLLQIICFPLFSRCFKENAWHHLNRFLTLQWEIYSLNFDPELMLKIKSQMILLFYFSMLPLPPVPLFFFKQADPCGGPMFPGTGPSCLRVFPQGWVFAVGGRWCVGSFLPAACSLTLTRTQRRRSLVNRGNGLIWLMASHVCYFAEPAGCSGK